MTHRSWAVMVAAYSLFSVPLGAAAIESPLPVFVDGKRVDRHSGSALERGGVAYIEAVRAVRLFDGFLRFGAHGLVRVTVDHRTMTFTVKSKTARLDGVTVALPAAPFLRDGDVFLPLATVAKLGSSRVVVDEQRHIVSFKLGGGEGFANPSLAASRRADLDEAALSPVLALSIVTTGTIDAKGLHARAAVRNTTAKPYELSFPGAKEIAFVLLRDGSEVWNSTSSVAGGASSSFSIAAGETKTVAADYPNFEALGPGRYQLRVRLMTLIPLDLAPISLGVVAPSPTPSR